MRREYFIDTDGSVVVGLSDRIPAPIRTDAGDVLLSVDAAALFLCLGFLQRGILGIVRLLAVDAKLATVGGRHERFDDTRGNESLGDGRILHEEMPGRREFHPWNADGQAAERDRSQAEFVVFAVYLQRHCTRIVQSRFEASEFVVATPMVDFQGWIQRQLLARVEVNLQTVFDGGRHGGWQ